MVCGDTGPVPWSCWGKVPAPRRLGGRLQQGIVSTRPSRWVPGEQGPLLCLGGRAGCAEELVLELPSQTRSLT